MSDEKRAHPRNVEGPFYVVDGCCTACGVPEASAPEMFAWDHQSHCFVKRQPSTQLEVDQMLDAVRGAELNCIRYRGLDSDILTRFAELGEPGLCDRGARFDLRPVTRNQLTFVFAGDAAKEPGDLASALRQHLLALDPDRYRATPVTSNHGRASFSCAWSEDRFHPIAVVSLREPATWLIKHEGNVLLSDLLQRWLTRLGATQLRWFADSDLTRAGPWRATPW